MAHYFIQRSEATETCEVHRQGCVRMPCDKQYLGDFLTVRHALLNARVSFWQPTSCERCSKEWPRASKSLIDNQNAALERRAREILKEMEASGQTGLRARVGTQR